VIFDLWNTLIAVPSNFSPYPRIVRLFHLETEGAFRDVMRAEWMTRSDLSVDDFFDLFVERERPTLNGQSQDEAKAAFAAIWVDYLDHVEVLPEAQAVLAKLRDSGLKTAIVTNTVEPSLDALEKLGLTTAVDIVHGSSRCGYLKPDPRIFLPIIEQLQVPPERIAVVGDKLRTDILGGLILGMRTVYLDSRVETPQVDCGLPVDAVIPSLADLPNVLGLQGD
jgi:putative hydrolase of the HAD superfamily